MRKLPPLASIPAGASALALALALVLPLAPRPAAAVEPERARNSPCTGIYTGSARGVFWCRVVAVHDKRTNRSTLKIETEDDIQLNGDALAIVPGAIEWTGVPAVGALQSGEGPVATAFATLQTGQPPNQVDYGAARSALRLAPDQGQVTLDLVRADPGAKNGETQAWLVHGTFQARLLPLPGSKGVGEVRVTVRF